MIIFRLTEEEKELLHSYFKTSPITLIRYKAQAILMRDNGLRIKDVAQSLLKSQRTITRWIKDFSQRRMASIFSGLVDNQNAAKLTRIQKEEIAHILKQSPHSYRLPKEFWDVPQLKQYVKAEFGIVYESTQSYHYLLKFSNFSFKQPDVFDIRRDEKEIHKRLSSIRKEIIPYTYDDDWVVLAADETRMLHEAITRRAWLKRGERTMLKVQRNNESQYYFGLLNIKTGKAHIIALNWGNQGEIIKALEGVVKKLYPNKKICIVWDNVSFHKGNKLRQRLKKGESLERIHLINFPPYAPDCNPQESIWNRAKGHIANRQFKTFAGTKRSFTHFISTHIFNYTI